MFLAPGLLGDLGVYAPVWVTVDTKESVGGFYDCSVRVGLS